MQIPFIKIDNAGNDYIYVSRRSLARLKINRPALARRLSNSHGGVGSDGLIIVDAKGTDKAGIEIFNKDGSIAELCGNGLRGTLLFLKKTVGGGRKNYKISTNWNEYQARILKSESSSIIAGTSLGQPSFGSRDIGYEGDFGSCMGIKVRAARKNWTLFCIALPNPHAVIFVDNFDFDWQEVGMAIENNPIFKNRINVMFARVDSRGLITVYPWERGSGATLACGSGAAAVAVVSRMLGKIKREVTIAMPGGRLRNRWDIGNNEIYQSGPSRIVFSGIFQI